jgi:hypothetical protein
MKITRNAAVLLFSFTMSVASQGALANQYICAVEMGNVEYAIEAAVFAAKGPRSKGKDDQAQMFLKVQEAISKLREEKYDDAIGKLVDIADKAAALADSPKQKLADDTAIQSTIYNAMVCINDR